jgi:hypothetical protein
VRNHVHGSQRSQQIPNPCVVILHNRDLPNSPSFTGERNSHHLMTGNGTPYIYSLVQGEGLSIADNNHTVMNKANENVYAIDLSHEIAEMVVDPTGDNNNPEVCDACSTGCNSFNLYTLFDQNGLYMGGTQDISSASGFAFFINSIVRSGTALDSNFCVTQGGNVQSACIYPPPFEAGQLLAYLDDGTPGNVSNPLVVGFGGWLDFKFLFSGRNVSGDNRIYAVDQSGQRNILRGPGQQDFDVAVMKTTPLTERVKLIFRWEIFNVLNRPNFANPSNNVSARSTFGTISALTVNPRIMQYALKLQF